MEWSHLADRLLPAGGWGAFLLAVGTFAWAVFSDRIVTRRRLDEAQAEIAVQRKIAEAHDARADELMRQNGEMLSERRVLEATLKALPRTGQRGR